VTPDTFGPFFDTLNADSGADYITTVQSLDEAHRALGRDWLFDIVRETEELAARFFPLTYA